MLSIQRRVSRPFAAFQDRTEAGRALARAVCPQVSQPAASEEERRCNAVLAVPRGGVAVAAPLAEALHAPLDLLIVRKLPIPDSPEAGFGAVALDGSVVLNEPLVRDLGLSRPQIDAVVKGVLAEVRRRAREYAGHARPPEPDVRGKRVWLVDDGLASGFTMIAAARMVKQCEPARMTLCVPVSPHNSLKAVEPYFDEVQCLIEQAHPPFAVASFYEDFHDLTDEQVRAIVLGFRRRRAARSPG
jgi:putative phosphoribosyl transferase